MKHYYSKHIKFFLLTACCITQFCYSSTYVWGLFQPLICEKYKVSLSASTFPYTIYMCLYALGSCLCTLLKKRFSPKICIMIGNFFMCSGLILSAWIPQNTYFLLYITFGVFSSLGCGISYCMVYECALAAFPQQHGLVSGLMAFALGISGAIISPAIQYFAAIGGFSYAIGFIGIMFFILTSLSNPFIKDTYSITLNNCPKTTSISPRCPLPAVPSMFDKPCRELFLDPGLYLFIGSFLMFFPAYLTINPMVVTLGVSRGLSTQDAELCVTFGSIASAAGSLLIPVLIDKFNSNRFLLFAGSMLLICCSFLLLGPSLFYSIAYPALPFLYAGIMASVPMYITRFFGIKNYPVIYSFSMAGLSLCSLASPCLQNFYKTPVIMFLILASLTVSGIICNVLFLHFTENGNRALRKRQDKLTRPTSRMS